MRKKKGQIKNQLFVLHTSENWTRKTKKTTLKSAEAGASRDTTPEIYLSGEEAAGAKNLWEHLSGNLINYWRLNED